MNLLRFDIKTIAMIVITVTLSSCSNSHFSSSTNKIPTHQNNGGQGRSPSGFGVHPSNSNDTNKRSSKEESDEDSANSETESELSESDTAEHDELSDQEIDLETISAKQHKQIFLKAEDVTSSTVDVIFAMDTSGSMSDEKARLESAMSKFLQKFEAESKAIDYQIYMIGQGFNFPGTGEKITKVPHHIGSHNALSVLTAFFTNKISNTKPLRADSSKQIIVISDDNAEGTTSTQFKELIQKTPVLTSKSSFHAIVGLQNGQNSSGCTIERVGQTYIDLASDRQIGGLSLDLCRSDWSDLLNDLATKIIKKIAKSAFKLERAANPKKPIEVFIDNKRVSSENYQYIEATQSIILAETLPIATGSELKVIFWPIQTKD